MRRVLLIVDDYGELLFLQTLLKKLGFDVDGIQNERGFEESYLSLNPEVVIATAKGKRVNGIKIVENLHRNRGLPKCLLLAGGPLLDRVRSVQIANVDGVVETPVNVMQMLSQIATVAQLDKQALLDKYRKLKATLSPDREVDLQILQGDKLPEAAPAREPRIQSTVSGHDREKRYIDFIAAAEVPRPGHFSRAEIDEFTKGIRASEDKAETEKLEAERQAFVKALFRKAKT